MNDEGPGIFASPLLFPALILGAAFWALIVGAAFWVMLIWSLFA